MIFCRVWTHYFTVGRQVYSVQYGRSTLPLGYNDILQSMDALLYRWTTMIFCKYGRSTFPLGYNDILQSMDALLYRWATMRFCRVWTPYYTVVTQLHSVEYGRTTLPLGYNDIL
ncbi:hypothetical protein RRG08_014031 [Elysia crispata]|uniref:Uncharacterized protein n=1 Tax=Elysia crispata TaxID=231223 RepID=A0AAE1A006_9GAST|nr:hypothetical protein RRG08_014031 [Elysia crispata]